MTTTRQILAAFTTTLLLGACGGGSSDGGDATAGGPGATQPTEAVTVGAVQSTASGLTVNGVTFRTSGARLTSDDDSVTLSGEDHVKSHVREGMVVRVRGTRDDSGGHATEIELHDLLEGRIDDRGPGRVRVGGVEVSVDDSTIFEDHRGGRLGPDDFSGGERIEVSGHADDKGGLRATSVRKSGLTEVEREVKAWVVAVNGAVVDLAFSKGGAPAVQVNVSRLSPAPSLSAGDFVEVKSRAEVDASGIPFATELHHEDDLSAGANVRLHLEGLVGAVDGGGFTIAGQRVAVGASTVYVGGTRDDVVPGVKVEAEGTIGADGVLAASKVKFRPLVRVEASVTSVDAAASTLSILGLTAHVTPATDLRGASGLAAIPAGARVEVRGSPTRDGRGVNAMRVEVIDEEPADRAFLRGVVTAKTGTSGLEILGLSIDAGGAEFRSLADAPMSAGAFFDAVVPGRTLVKVRWRPYPATTAAAVDEAELEHP
jgi:hypothetical protein